MCQPIQHRYRQFALNHTERDHHNFIEGYYTKDKQSNDCLLLMDGAKPHANIFAFGNADAHQNKMHSEDQETVGMLACSSRRNYNSRIRPKTNEMVSMHYHSSFSLSKAACYSLAIFGKRFFNIGSFIRYIVLFSIMLSVSNNVTCNSTKANEIVSNLTIKIDAVQQSMNRLIDALAGNSSTPDHNISFVVSEGATGNFTRPNQSDKLAMLENEMKKMKGDIEQLIQSANITAEDKTRLANLESSVEVLQKLLDDQKHEMDQKLAQLEALIEFLLGTIKELRAELDSLKRKAELEEEDRRMRRLPTECIEAIKSHDFITAESKLQEMNDDTKINLIVNNVYDHHQSNFELLLRFAESITVKQRGFLVLKALNYEMDNNGHKDPFKMVKLVGSLRRNIIANQNTSAQTKQQAGLFENDLNKSIKTVSKEKLKQAMLNNVYESNEIQTLSNDIFRVSDKLFGDIIKDVVNEIFQLMDTKKILKYIKSHSFVQQSVLGYSAVFNRIRYSNSDSLFSIAYYIKDAMEAPSFASLDSNYKSTLNQLKNSLPQSVRNAAFASKVCIENKIYPKYLYASGKYLHDNPRRHVFTWMPDNKRDVNYREDHWELIRTGDSFYIYNVAHREYMYSPSEYKDFKQGNDRRKVFTWTEGGSFDSCKWKLEPAGDNVYIKSAVRSEYLYTSNRYKHANVQQKIFTWIPGGRVRNGLWTIVDCSNA
ncbi:uncharacterized protein LOC5564242 [Aedes aegypti]|uniref:Uncharacterized protein n=1 Tax=Aedes aegypti TaxID=7159 RepID=A0A6I8T6X8_AEDAE|nr:uncharacterized protein LOC5564242 [Aedes aegypti]